MSTTQDTQSREAQTAYVVTALAAALTKQPGIDGQKLLSDFLEIVKSLPQSSRGLETVPRNVAVLMEATMRTDAQRR